MVELKEKTVEELRKMASKKKIEGRSKMNKSELVRALKKTTSTKKTIKRRKMKGGALDNEQIVSLVERNYTTNPMTLRRESTPPNSMFSRFISRRPKISINKVAFPPKGNNLYIRFEGSRFTNTGSFPIKFLTISRDGDILIYNDSQDPNRVNVPEYDAPHGSEGINTSLTKRDIDMLLSNNYQEYPIRYMPPDGGSNDLIISSFEKLQDPNYLIRYGTKSLFGESLFSHVVNIKNLVLTLEPFGLVLRNHKILFQYNENNPVNITPPVSRGRENNSQF